MTTRQSIWSKTELHRLRIEFGGRCSNPQCQEEVEIDDLEFAHIEETRLNGGSRGMYHRVLDIRANKFAYILLSHGCHKQFDDGELTFFGCIFHHIFSATPANCPTCLKPMKLIQPRVSVLRVIGIAKAQ